MLKEKIPGFPALEKREGVGGLKEQINVFDEKKAQEIVDIFKVLARSGTMTDELLHHSGSVVYRLLVGRSECYRHRENEELNKIWKLELDKLATEYQDSPDFDFSSLAKKGGWVYAENKVETRENIAAESNYRLYLNPDNDEAVRIFKELYLILKKEEVSFSAKTLNIDKYLEFDPRDKIIFYLAENELNKSFPIIQEYLNANKDVLDHPGVLMGQNLSDSDGDMISGAVVTSDDFVKEVKIDDHVYDSHKSFNFLQQNIISEVFFQIIKDKEGVDSKIWQVPENIVNILNQPGGAEYVVKEMTKKYAAVAKKFGLAENNTAFTTHG